MCYLLVGDLHLTDRPRDAYRFEIFDWVKKQQDKYDPKATFLMGDITDQKDRHSATLVNKTVQGLRKLGPIFILMGNHDYTDADNPFFGFLNYIDDIFFISDPEILLGSVAVMPHIRNEEQFQAHLRIFKEQPQRLDLLLLHNTMQGALSETGAVLHGYKMDGIEALTLGIGCFAGDIHHPQTTGPVTYVGTPYHVRFGDNFKPRCLLVCEDGKCLDLYPDFPSKWKVTVQTPDELFKDKRLTPGSQVKVTVELTKDEVPEWQTYKAAVTAALSKLGVDNCGVDLKVLSSSRKASSKAPVTLKPKDIITAFCKAEKAPQLVKETGFSLLES